MAEIELLTNADVSGEAKLVLTNEGACQVLKNWVISNLGCAGYLEDCLDDGAPLPIPSFMGKKGIGELTDQEIVKELIDMGISDQMYEEAKAKYEGFHISIFVNNVKVD